MEKKKISGAAVFMYSSIVLTAIVAAVFLYLYYSGAYKNGFSLWTGIVSLMIFYHFGLRIVMGEVTKYFKIDYKHPWFKERFFEKKLYKWLRVRGWKDKVLTFDPDAYDFKKRTLEELATTMAKSETDHWINELISLTSLMFYFVFGNLPAFVISAVAAMLFDAQFIVVQRFNRPIVLRLNQRLKNREKEKISR